MKRIMSLALCAVMVLSLVALLPQNASAAAINSLDVLLDHPVASYTPDTSATFMGGRIPSYAVTWKENFPPSFTATLKSSDEFQAGLPYKVEIWMRCYANEYFATDIYGQLSANITVNGKKPTSVQVQGRDSDGLVNTVLVTYEFGALPGSVLNRVQVTGIPTPVEGNMPIYSFTLGSLNYSFYHTQPVTWRDVTDNYREMDSSDTFVKGHKYQVSIWLRANRETGFTFKVGSNGDPEVSAALNSWAADKVITAYEQDPREVIEILYTFAPCQAAHTCAPAPVRQKDPTCTTPGRQAYYQCSCGKAYKDAAATQPVDLSTWGLLKETGHTESDWRITQVYHYIVCTDCGEMLRQEDHFGGTETCTEKAKCAACGTAYGQNEPSHRWGPKFDYKDSKGHAWICADCKAHDTVQPHNPGPAATETTPQTCKDCGYVIQSAINHIHKLTQVAETAPTCIAPGVAEHYSCDGCSDLFQDAAGTQKVSGTELVIPAQGHQPSNEHGFDDQNHWYLCVLCKEAMTETQEAHTLQSGKCSICGYGEDAPTVPTEATEPTEPQPTEPVAEENKGAMQWLLPVIIAVVFFAVAVTVTVLVLKKRR